MFDETVHDIISREAYEESNYLLDKDSIKKRLAESSSVYIPHSKYIVYLVKATDIESKLKTDDFGDKEIHDDIPRQVKWIPLTTFLNPNIIKHKVAMRLKHKNLFDMVKNLKKSISEWEILESCQSENISKK